MNNIFFSIKTKQYNNQIKILVTGGNGNIAKIIKNNLSINPNYKITTLGRSDLNILNYEDIKKYLNDEKNKFDILVHTAILGGRRGKEENNDTTHINLIMFENIIKFAHMFKMIINLDSAAIYDRSTDIYYRGENELNTIPYDYYGFSKYLIYHRSLAYKNVFNFRLFNIFYSEEENDRFIKLCFEAKYNYDNDNDNKKQITIFEDKYFDFVYELDFIKIVDYYWSNINNQESLIKTINICYEKKYKLSDIAKLILSDNTNNTDNTDNTDKIIITNDSSSNNYCGDASLLYSLGIKFDGLEKSLEIYELKYYVEKINKLKNMYAPSNFDIDEKILNFITKISNHKSYQDFYSQLIKNDSLETIFNENNIDHKNIKFIIFTLPKTGTQTLKQSLLINQELVLQFHSIIELLYIDFRFINYTVYDIIKFIESNTTHDKIYIISSYRNPFERYISFYFHKQKFDQLINLSDFITKSDFIETDILDNFNYFFIKQMNQFGIKLFEHNYDKKNGICLIEYSNKINWLFTCLNDINIFITNLHLIINDIQPLVIVIDNVNNSENYLRAKNNMTFELNLKNEIYEEEKEYINFFQI
jgi:nucleoside-diphosphate-sugar epimerase